MKTVLRPAADWHDDDGSVLWWRVPISEPPFVGSPLGDDWREDYYTHWCPLPDVADPTRDPPPPPFAITLAPTKQVAVLEASGGEKILARIWRGSFKGHEVQALVTGVGLDVEAPKAVHAEWERELIEIVGGPIAWIPNDSAADDADVKAPAFDPDKTVDPALDRVRGQRCARCKEWVHNRATYHQCFVDPGQVPFDQVPILAADPMSERERHAAEVHEAVRQAARESAPLLRTMLRTILGVTDDIGPAADDGITHALQEATGNETCGHCGRTIKAGRYLYVDVRPKEVQPPRHITCPRCEAIETAVDQMNGVMRRHAGLDGHRVPMFHGVEIIVDDEMQPNDPPYIIDLSKAGKPQ